MQEIRSVKDADVAGKRVLVRVDFNVPIKDGKVQSDLRILAALQTLELLQKKGAAKIILLAHLGRPDGKAVEGLRMAQVEARVRELTAVPFELHENLRFDPREEQNDDAFAVIGGVKFETKVPLIKKLLELYAEVLLGGALANDVIKARGLPFGGSLVSNTPVPEDIASSERLLIPDDAIFAETGSNAERSGRVVDIRAGERIIDIGPATSKQWAGKVSKASFVLWNGPMGIYEQGYRDGTDVLAAELVRSGVPAVVGGGDTAAAVSKFSFDPQKVF